MNHDGEKVWLDGFLLHEMIKSTQEEANEEDNGEDDSLVEDDDEPKSPKLPHLQCGSFCVMINATL